MEHAQRFDNALAVNNMFSQSEKTLIKTFMI